MNKIKEYLFTWFENKNIRKGTLACVALFLCLFFLQQQKLDQVEVAPVDSDELIPEGFSLVPIQLQNGEALQSIIGSFAVVNLYAAGVDGLTAKNLVGKKIKLIRTSKNSQSFSALIKAEEAPTLLSQSEPLFAVVLARQNSNQSGMTKKNNGRQRIHFL